MTAEMSQQLGALITLAEGPDSVPISHITTYKLHNSSSRASDALLTSPLAPGMHIVKMHICETNICKNKINKHVLKSVLIFIYVKTRQFLNLPFNLKKYSYL